LLPGIMRRAVLETCRRAGIPAEERPVAPEEIIRADECFLTSSLLVVMPLVEVGGMPVGSGRPGAVTGRIRAAVLAMMEWAGVF
ncbi:MAG: aminotransferase class IV, partial [Desulfotomaculales bacterium]